MTPLTSPPPATASIIAPAPIPRLSVLREFLPWIAFYTLLVLLVIRPVLGSYMWLGHEIFAPMIRVMLMSEIWQAQGPFHAPWLPAVCYGYGWPFFTFYAPLGYYVSSALQLGLGISAGMGLQLSFYLSLWLGGLAFFALGTLWLPGATTAPRGFRRGAWCLAAAALYSFAPYHHADIFARCSLAESWGFTLFPWLIWGLEITRRRPRAGLLATSLIYALFMLSHNITALYGTLFVGVYMLATLGQGAPRGGWWHWPLRVGIGLTLGLALSAYFWWPALRLVPLVRAHDVNNFWGSGEILHAHALRIRQFFMEQYGRGFSIPKVNDGLAINPGLLTMFALALGLGALLLRRVDFTRRRQLGVLLVLAALALAATTIYWPWGAMPAMLRYIQFPWRLLLFVVGCGALVLLLVAPWLRHTWLALALALCPALIAGLLAPGMVIQTLEPATTDAEVMQSYFSHQEGDLGQFAGSVAREYLPVWVDANFGDTKYLRQHPAPESRLELLAGQWTLQRFTRRGADYQYAYTAPAPVRVRAHLFDFPGWELALDGQPAPLRLGRDATGLLTLDLPAGQHQFHLCYTLSRTGRQARTVSAAAWVAWFFLLIGGAVRHRRRTASL